MQQEADSNLSNLPQTGPEVDATNHAEPNPAHPPPGPPNYFPDLGSMDEE